MAAAAGSRSRARCSSWPPRRRSRSPARRSLTVPARNDPTSRGVLPLHAMETAARARRATSHRASSISPGVSAGETLGFATRAAIRTSRGDDRVRRPAIARQVLRQALLCRGGGVAERGLGEECRASSFSVAACGSSAHLLGWLTEGRPSVAVDRAAVDGVAGSSGWAATSGSSRLALLAGSGPAAGRAQWVAQSVSVAASTPAAAIGARRRASTVGAAGPVSWPARRVATDPCGVARAPTARPIEAA
jgi:hypothetical protein